MAPLVDNPFIASASLHNPCTFPFPPTPGLNSFLVVYGGSEQIKLFLGKREAKCTIEAIGAPHRSCGLHLGGSAGIES